MVVVAFATDSAPGVDGQTVPEAKRSRPNFTNSGPATVQAVDTATSANAHQMVRRYGPANCNERRSTRPVSARSRRSSSPTALPAHMSANPRRVAIAVTEIAVTVIAVIEIVVERQRGQHGAVALAGGQELGQPRYCRRMVGLQLERGPKRGLVSGRNECTHPGLDLGGQQPVHERGDIRLWDGAGELVDPAVVPNQDGAGTVDFLPKTKVEVVVSDAQVPAAIDAIAAVFALLFLSGIISSILSLIGSKL